LPTNGKLVIEESGTSVGSTIRLIGTNTSGSASQVSHITSYQPAGGTAEASALDFKVRGSDPYATPSTVMTLLGGGNVGIGVSAPTYKIDATTTSGGNGIKMARGADSFFEQFQSATGGIQLAASGSGAFMAFRTGTTAGTTTERMRLDASGNLLVGKTATTLSVAGTYISAAGSVGVTRASDDCLTLNRTGSDGAIASFYKDGTTVGSIGAISSDLEIHSSVSDHVGIRFANGGLFPTDNTGTVTNGAADIGNGSYRFKDLFLSGGVVFGDAGGSGTSSSNTLDSYEEGTWTPTLPNGGTLTPETNTCLYTKTGRQVTVTAFVSSVAPTNNASEFLIGGLPFTAISPAYFSGSFGFVGDSVLTGWMPLVLTNSTAIGFRITTGSPDARTNAGYLTAASGSADRFIITATYFTA
jgi:hypothetical protein